jgi:FeS assembly SUF system protein
MKEEMSVFELEAKIVTELKNIYDPEIPVNIYDLGLIYEIDVQEEGKVKLVMTLTAPNCPIIDDLLNEIKERIEHIPGIREVDLVLTFDPPWDKSMMSEEAQLQLGFL